MMKDECACVRVMCAHACWYVNTCVCQRERKRSSACLFVFKLIAGVRASVVRFVNQVKEMKPTAELIF